MRIVLFLGAMLALLHATPQEMQALLEKAKSAKTLQDQENAAREARFKSSLAQQKALTAQAQAQLEALKKESIKLNTHIDTNEKKLAALEEKLHIRSGNLGELKGIIKQMAGDFYEFFVASATAKPASTQFLKTLSSANRLPNIATLTSFWTTVLEELSNGYFVQKTTLPLIGANGAVREGALLIAGAFGAVYEGNYYNYDTQSGMFVELGKQPGGALSSWANAAYDATKPLFDMPLDPTRGELLRLSTASPTIGERIDQGSTVGYVILFIGGLGLLFALYKFWVFVRLDIALHKKLFSSPLVQLENFYQTHAHLLLDQLEHALESHLSKARTSIEKGLSLLKLVATLAPLMGLLGTVTGMIATFSAITLFGTGDPKLMAGGISQALVTTVEGLIVAITLLFIYTLLNTRAKEIIAYLDERALELLSHHKDA